MITLIAAAQNTCEGIRKQLVTLIATAQNTFEGIREQLGTLSAAAQNACEGIRKQLVTIITAAQNTCENIRNLLVTGIAAAQSTDVIMMIIGKMRIILKFQQHSTKSGKSVGEKVPIKYLRWCAKENIIPSSKD